MKINYSKYVMGISFVNLKDGKSGISKYILTQINEANKKSIGYIYLFAVKKMIHNKILMCRFGLQIDNEFIGVFSIEQIIQILKKYSIDIERIYIHHFIYIRLRHIEFILKNLNKVSVDIFLHDYYLCCKNYFLYRDGSYCASKQLNKTECSKCSFYKKSMDMENRTHKLIKKYINRIRFISPSECTKNIFLSFHPEYENYVDVIPHQIIQVSDSNERLVINEKIRIAYIGRRNEKKGWNDFIELVDRYKEKFDFYVINSYNEKIEGSNYLMASFDNSKNNGMVNILKDNNIDVAFIWAKWPETYSYVAFEAYAAQTYIITFKDSGNIVDLVIKEKCGKIYSSFNSLLDDLDDYPHFENTIKKYKINLSKSIMYEDNMFIGVNSGQKLNNEVIITPNKLSIINYYLTKYYLKKYFS